MIRGGFALSTDLPQMLNVVYIQLGGYGAPCVHDSFVAWERVTCGCEGEVLLKGFVCGVGVRRGYT